MKAFFLPFFCTIILLFSGWLVLYKAIVVKPLTKKSLSSYKNQKALWFWEDEMIDIGLIPNNQSPTDFRLFKPDSERIRIGCFGDSFTSGTEVLTGEDFPSQLQEVLGKKYQVFNFGQGGYSSNQFYLLAMALKEKYQLDYILLGPRGFFNGRNHSFNRYWIHGTLPNARFIKKGQNIKKIDLVAKTADLRLKEFYSIWPSETLYKYDESSLSIFKLFHFIFRWEFLNPFFISPDQEDDEFVQRHQVETLAKSFKGKIIHITDSSEDCRTFASITQKNYLFKCLPGLIHKFPFVAWISHASSLGNFRLARHFSSVIKNEENNFPGAEEDSKQFVAYQARKDDIEEQSWTGLEIQLKNLAVASIRPVFGYSTSTGAISKYFDTPTDPQSNVLIGFYGENDLKANSLFLMIPKSIAHSGFLEKLNPMSHKHIKDLFFKKIPDGDIWHFLNKIYFQKKPENEIWTFLFETISEKDYWVLKSKYPIFKMVLDKSISPSKLIEEMKRNQFIFRTSKSQHIWTEPRKTF